jgi:hypothetical protein
MAVIFLLFSCDVEELECDPLFDPNCDSSSEQSSPETSILEANVDASSVYISWEGSESAFQFSYRLLPLTYDNPVSLYLDWSDWAPDTSVALEQLDEGEYNLYVKSRFNIDIEEVVPDSVNFTIDAIEGTGLRIYPLRQQVSSEGNGSQVVDIFLYAENIESFLGAEIEIQFSNEILQYLYSVPECGIGNDGFLCPDVSSGENIILWKWDGAGSFVSDQPIYQIRFDILEVGAAEIIISSATVRDSNNDDIIIETLQSAQIEVLP